jgi:putative transposase
MPRSVRVEYAGAVYHVMCRGDRREPIFTSDEDRRLMLSTVEETCERTGIWVHSYVLMPNHYHMLMETPEPNLVVGMKWFQGTYTQRYNSRYRQSGHVFQGRYKAVPMEGDEPKYFRIVSDYIHLNPARAGLLDPEQPNLKSFPWSSYPRFVEGGELPKWLRRDRVFSSQGFPDEGRGSRKRYETRMDIKVGEIMGGQLSDEREKEWNRLRRGWYLGGAGFRERLWEQIDRGVKGKQRASYSSEGLCLHDERTAKACLKNVLSWLGITRDQIRTHRQNDPLKQAVAWYVKSRTVVGDAWICQELDMGSRANVSRAVCAFRHAPDRVRKKLKDKMSVCAD